MDLLTPQPTHPPGAESRGDVVEEYFAVVDGPDPSRAVDLFTADAVVSDDGAVHRGRAEVLGWLRGAVSEWTTTSSRLSTDRRERTVVVLTRVVGDFPGGTVDLRHEFSLAPDGRIGGLSITA